MKICYFGIYDPSYGRHSVLLNGLRMNGVQVVECRADWRDRKRYEKIRHELKALNNDYDAVFAAYPSSMPAIIAKIFSKKPVFIDAFYSNFDSVVNDRRKYKWFDPRSLKMLFYDWLGVLVSDVAITDTVEHKKYWQTWLGLKKKKMEAVYIGAEDSIFKPTPFVKKDQILVLFHGTFIPLQGVTKIVEAANLCASESKIKFRFVGDGRDFNPAKKLAEKYALKNIEFTGMRPLAEINQHLAEADIVLGIFGDTAKAHRVIPNKVYEGLQARRPVITMDGSPIREAFTDEDMLMVKNEPQAIADAIIRLSKDAELRERLANHGYETVKAKFTPRPLGKMFKEVIEKYI